MENSRLTDYIRDVRFAPTADFADRLFWNIDVLNVA
jgi:hypothetical protein